MIGRVISRTFNLKIGLDDILSDKYLTMVSMYIRIITIWPCSVTLKYHSVPMFILTNVLSVSGVIPTYVLHCVHS